MLRKLTLVNYMSYDKCTITFPERGVIAVCGEVGTGKSGLLEAIYYNIYGFTKVSMKYLVKIGHESMETLGEYRILDNDYTIKRGIRKSDKGYLELRLNGDVIASGTAAQQYINELLGESSDLFSLTSFFGAGDLDTLIDTLPSTRLETLQRIGNVDRFIKLHKEINQKRTSLQSEIESLKKVIATRKESLPDEVEINTAIEQAQVELNGLNDDILKVAQERKSIMMEIERVSAFITEKDSLSSVIFDLNKSLNRLLRDQEAAKSDLQSKKKKINEFIKERETNLDDLNNYTKLEILNKNLSNNNSHIAAFKANLQVYESGLSLNRSKTIDKCPLCNGAVDENTAKIWKDKIIDVKKKIIRLEDEVKSLNSEIDSVSSLNENIASIDAELEAYNNHIKDIEKNISGLDSEITKKKSEIAKKELRVKKIDTELKDSIDVKDRLSTIDNEITQRHTRQGELEADIRNYKNQLKEREKMLNKIKSDERTLKSSYDSIAALNLCSDAFSRYGIPFDLLEGLKRKISKEASRLCSYFVDASIEVRDVVVRSNPGVSYFFIDELGEREYSVLSKGQRRIVGLCIRLAVAFILRSSLKISNELLILDEVAGELDEHKRDLLVKVVVGLLKKYFSQIFMVSHASLRKVFTDTLNLSIDGGKSVVERV